MINWINVLDYGADPKGTKDSLQAFETALDKINRRGGVLYIPAGMYLLSNTLTIGDGTTKKDSTIQSIRIEGECLPRRGWNRNTEKEFVNNYGVALIRTGTNKGPLIQFNGPMSNCGISNVRLDGSKSASHCLLTKNCGSFSLINCHILGATNIGYECTSHQGISGMKSQPNSHNLRIDGCWFFSIEAGVTQLKLTGDLKGEGSDTNLAYVTNTQFYFSGHKGKGLHLDFCDSSTFSNVSFFRTPIKVEFDKSKQTFTYELPDGTGSIYALKKNDIVSFESVTKVGTKYARVLEDTNSETYVKDFTAPTNINPSQFYYARDIVTVNSKTCTFKLAKTINGPAVPTIKNNTNSSTEFFELGCCTGSNSILFSSPIVNGVAMNMPSQISFFHVNPGGGPPEVDWQVVKNYSNGKSGIPDRIFAYGVMEMDNGRSPTSEGFVSISDFGNSYNLNILQATEHLTIKKDLAEINMLSSGSQRGYRLFANITDSSDEGFQISQLDVSKKEFKNSLKLSFSRTGEPRLSWIINGKTENLLTRAQSAISSPIATTASLKTAVDKIIETLKAHGLIK